MNEEETEVGGDGVLSESLGLVCGGITLVPVEAGVGRWVRASVDDRAD